MDATVLDHADHLSLSVDAADVRTASTWLERVSCACGVPDEQIYRLDLCLNEVLANILAHGGSTVETEPVLLALHTRPGEEYSAAALTITDAGRAFNPLTTSPQPVPLTLAEATPGGLGLTMLSHFSDDLSYRYHAGRNHLTITVRWPRS
jgi:anti-sigma regulatory factor (Ser/Thr protein kinase)